MVRIVTFSETGAGGWQRLQSVGHAKPRSRASQRVEYHYDAALLHRDGGIHRRHQTDWPGTQNVSYFLSTAIRRRAAMAANSGTQLAMAFRRTNKLCGILPYDQQNVSFG